MTVLVADIGGTKTNMGIFSINEQQPDSLFEATYISNEHQSIEEIITLFLAAAGTQDNASEMLNFISGACFGVAGSVKNNYSKVTNLPWVIDGNKIQQQFDWQRLDLLNDLEANAWGIAALNEDDFVILNVGESNSDSTASSSTNDDDPDPDNYKPIQEGNASIIAAGTGLGEAGLFWDGHTHIPFASEGGHADFSPATEQEYRLHQFLSSQYNSHISWERVVSGMGLESIYLFLCQDTHTQPPLWLQEQMQIDAAAAISNAGINRQDELCHQAISWFVYFYGIEASNHALKIMSRGGVFLGGGIAPKIIAILQSGLFMQAFCDKGRMQSLLQAMPVKVIMNDKTALYGSALYAFKQSH